MQATIVSVTKVNIKDDDFHHEMLQLLYNEQVKLHCVNINLNPPFCCDQITKIMEATLVERQWMDY